MTDLSSASRIAVEARKILLSLGVDAARLQGGGLVVHSPIDGAPIAALHETTGAEANEAIGRHASTSLWSGRSDWMVRP